MDYKIFADLWEALKLSPQNMKDAYAHLEMSSTGFKQSFDRQTLTLKNYIKLCEFLGVKPSFFFETQTANILNDSNIQYATGKQIKQTIGSGSEVEQLKKEIEALKRENSLKDEIISLLKSKS